MKSIEQNQYKNSLNLINLKIKFKLTFYKSCICINLYTYHFTKKVIGNAADHSESTIPIHWPQCNIRTDVLLVMVGFAESAFG